MGITASCPSFARRLQAEPFDTDRVRAGLKVNQSVKDELLALRPQTFTGGVFVQKR